MEKRIVSLLLGLLKAVTVAFEATYVAIMACVYVLPRVAEGIVTATGLSLASSPYDWVGLGLVPYLALAGFVCWFVAVLLKMLVPWTCRKIDALRDGILGRMGRGKGQGD